MPSCSKLKIVGGHLIIIILLSEALGPSLLPYNDAMNKYTTLTVPRDGCQFVSHGNRQAHILRVVNSQKVVRQRPNRSIGQLGVHTLPLWLQVMEECDIEF